LLPVLARIHEDYPAAIMRDRLGNYSAYSPAESGGQHPDHDRDIMPAAGAMFRAKPIR
jgi:hypothetical protein